MKAIKATLTTSQPVISEDEFNIMFYKIPDLHALHKNFLDGLKRRTQNWDGRLTIGDHFRIMVSLLQQPHRQSVISTHSFPIQFIVTIHAYFPYTVKVHCNEKE